ncbi:drug/metabolite transporter (DMT)-like permease [Geomicrobium halophilum]|uniref:Drug/metabolite transporter (DMT)-like permease n=1 Tax=Geomicrobium halophilum TaxID=549000 RepID=A0A841PR43_9BACL|nr:DMT family transporter [Geomicrobium halophilum]MBB6451239.1 drug/metabolite transporter (DMT)-like permease [Geomicrobium halophilum]
MSRINAYLCTVAGAASWGLIGLFITPLYERGFTAWEVVAIRAVISCTFLLLLMLIFFRPQLRTYARDHIFFAGAGILSISLFNFFYFEVFARSNLSLAVTLLYTGPLFVTLLSRLFFKEAFSPRKMLALLFAIVGCAFVVGLFPYWEAQVPWEVLVMGVLSGFCYALYSIFGKAVTHRYSALTVTTYTFLYSSIFMLFTSNLWENIDAFIYPEVWISAILLALVATVLGYVLYTTGLKHIEASKASILATVEPIVAVVTGVLFLGDHLLFWQVIGIALVLYSAVLVAERRKQVVA